MCFIVNLTTNTVEIEVTHACYPMELWLTLIEDISPIDAWGIMYVLARQYIMHAVSSAPAVQAGSS